MARRSARSTSTRLAGGARSVNGHLNPATRGAAAGLAVSGTALAAVALRERYQAKAAKRSSKSITKGHAGKVGGSPSRTTKSSSKGNHTGGRKGRKGHPLRTSNGKFAGWSS